MKNKENGSLMNGPAPPTNPGDLPLLLTLTSRCLIFPYLSLVDIKKVPNTIVQIIYLHQEKRLERKSAFNIGNPILSIVEGPGLRR